MADVSGRLAAALADRYEIVREIGRGGMATVYLAGDLKHHRQVALKVLRPELSATIGVDRFVREIEIAAGFTHPHILPVFDSGEADGLLYYVMPYVEGESLRERLAREGKLPVEEVIRLTGQIASALAHAHDRGYVHRDIKPENILLADDQAILADFGIARAFAAVGAERLTSTGLAIGTPAYMSPEQALASDGVDARTDVYALGCVVFEMVTGRPPYQGATPQATLAQHLAGKAPTLRTIEPAAPLFLERAVARALAPDPEARFSSARDFADAVTTGTVVARPGLRRWRRLATRAALGAVAFGGLAWATAAFLREPDIRRLAVLPLASLTADTAERYLVDGVHEALIGELGRLGLTVISRTSMMRYQGTDKPIRQIASELGVDGVIEGSFFRAGDSLEIAARLYHGTNERELWSGRYDGSLPDVVAMYRGFARAIADRVHLALSPEREARLATTAPVNPRVYEAYLRGMYLLTKPDGEDPEQALSFFEQAVAENPADPLAYTGLAFAYITLGHGPAPPSDALPRARAAAERAVRLDSTLAEAWAVRAEVKLYYEWDWKGAEQAFKRALALNPNLAGTWYHYSWFLVLHGRLEEALVAHRRAAELDPLTPLNTVWIPGLYLFAGEPERALTEARAMLERYPDHPIVLYVLGTAASVLGRHQEAVAAHEKMAAGSRFWLFRLGWTYARAGRTEDARRVLAELEAMPDGPWRAFGLAEVQAGLGNRDEAFRWLNYEPHHAWLAWSGGNHALRSIMDDPRFDTLMARIGVGTRLARR